VILSSKIYKLGWQKHLKSPEYPPANELEIKLTLIFGKESAGQSSGSPTVSTFSYSKNNRLALTSLNM
jgi:hypothetical protein